MVFSSLTLQFQHLGNSQRLSALYVCLWLHMNRQRRRQMSLHYRPAGCAVCGVFPPLQKSVICINDRDNQLKVLKTILWFFPRLYGGCSVFFSLVLLPRMLNCTHIFAVGVLVFEVEASVSKLLFPNFLFSCFLFDYTLQSVIQTLHSCRWKVPVAGKQQQLRLQGCQTQMHSGLKF